MIKRFIAIVMAFILLIMTAACSKQGSTSTSRNVVSPNGGTDKPELTIMISSRDYDAISKETAFMMYVNKFQSDMGVKVKFDELNKGMKAPNYDEANIQYLQKLGVKLTVKEGAELVYGWYNFPKTILEQGAVECLDGKVSNLSKVYDGLLQEQGYYAPFAMTYSGFGYRREALKELGVEELGLLISIADHNKLLSSWIDKGKTYLSYTEFGNVCNEYLSQLIWDYCNKSNKLNSPELIEKISSIRKEIFSGKYKLYENYSYKEYYKMFFEADSQEERIRFKLYDENVKTQLQMDETCNLFRAKDTEKLSKEYDEVIMAGLSDGDNYASTAGFMVNKKGKNKELAFEFINGLLSDEVQMSLFECDDNMLAFGNKQHLYPVNKEIEKDILEAEKAAVEDKRAIELKEYLIEELKAGKIKDRQLVYNRATSIPIKLWNDLMKIVLNEELLEDDKLAEELQKLENKYKIMLSE